MVRFKHIKKLKTSFKVQKKLLITVPSAGYTLDYAVKFFLDKPELIKRLVKQERRAFMRIGGFLRQTMRNSMKLSTASQPHSIAGQPPKYSPASGIGNIRNSILFFYQPNTHSLIVGPIKLNNASSSGVRPISRKTIPELLNLGGTAAGPSQRVLLNTKTGKFVYPYSRGGQMIVKRMTNRTKRRRGGVRAYRWVVLKAGTRTYRARPFVGPALKKAMAANRLAKAWETIRL